MASSSKNETLLLCPGEEAWDLWSQNGAEEFRPAPGGPPPVTAEGAPASVMGAKVFSFPVRAAFAVPLWVPTVDEEAVSGAMDIQLEKLNLKVDEGGGKLVETHTLEQSEGQTLALATVLNERQLKMLPGGGIPDQFEVSPFLFDLPENSLVLWKELGKIVVVLTRRDRPVHFQTLGAKSVTAAAVHEIELMLMQLDMQGLAGELEKIVLWTDAVEHEGEAALKQAFGVPVIRQRKPVPVLPETPAGFLPRQVAEARLARARSKRIKQIVLAAAAVYLAIAGTYGYFCVKDILAAKKLKQQRDGLNRVAGGVEAERERWLNMLDVTHADRYPLERFFQVTKMLDEGSQVRLTKFTFEKDKLIIAGEAENVPKAINYQNALSRDPALIDYEWDKNSPRGEKNGFASFQIVGTLKNALPVQP